MQKVHTYNFQVTHNLSIKISRNALVVSIRNLFLSFNFYHLRCSSLKFPRKFHFESENLD